MSPIYTASFNGSVAHLRHHKPRHGMSDCRVEYDPYANTNSLLWTPAVGTCGLSGRQLPWRLVVSCAGRVVAAHACGHGRQEDPSLDCQYPRSQDDSI